MLCVRFDTDDLPAARRFSGWQDAINGAFYAARRSPDPPEDFRARLAVSRLGGIELTEFAATRMHSLRNQSWVRTHPTDALFVSLLQRGRATLTVGRDNLVQREGAVVMWDAAIPHGWTYDSEIGSLCVKIPRPLLKLPERRHFMVGFLDGKSPIGTLVSDMIRNTFRIELPADGAAAHRLRASLVDAVAAGLEFQWATQAAVNQSRAVLLRAQDYIRCRLDDPDLDAAGIASALGVSTRSLNRAFAASGTTPVRWLWQQRLDTAHRLLTGAHAAQVTQAAMATGFSSLSHFSTAFRRAYGASPSAVLRRSRLK